MGNYVIWAIVTEAFKHGGNKAYSVIEKIIEF
jgi:hypothetical protein